MIALVPLSLSFAYGGYWAFGRAARAIDTQDWSMARWASAGFIASVMGASALLESIICH